MPQDEVIGDDLNNSQDHRYKELARDGKSLLVDVETLARVSPASVVGI